MNKVWKYNDILEMIKGAKTIDEIKYPLAVLVEEKKDEILFEEINKLFYTIDFSNEDIERILEGDVVHFLQNNVQTEEQKKFINKYKDNLLDILKILAFKNLRKENN